MMQSITFECEVITPMFLAGADGATPELRAPSIKGALRFWWRALNGHLPLEELKAREDEIFGGTSSRSKVILTASYTDKEMTDENVPTFNYLKSYPNAPKRIKYFHVFFYESNDDKLKDREGIAPGVKFNVTLRSKNTTELIEAATTFWVMSLLGGLGTRSRRGDGSFKINKSSRKGLTREDLPFYYEREGVHKLGSILHLGKLIKLNESDKITNFSSLQYADIFYSKGIAKGNGFSTWYNAMADIAHKMMQIRDNDTRFVGKERNDSKFTMNNMDKKAAFGLPINVRPPLGGTVNLYNEAKKGYEASRRASPLSIVINKVGKNYYWTITFLQGLFMPNSSVIKYEKSGRENEKWQWSKEDQTLVNEFRKKLINDWKEEDNTWEAEVEALKYGTEIEETPKTIKHIKL